MNPESVFTMISEKSIDINHLPGGLPEFTTQDAIHALSGMSDEEDYYCQYVFLSYDDKLLELTKRVYFYLTLEQMVRIKDAPKIFSLCSKAIRLQRTPNKRVPYSEIYNDSGITRGEWQSKYKSKYHDILSHLSNLQSGVCQHIYRRTK